MRVRTALVTGMLMMAGAFSAQAQDAGVVELGLFGRFTKFDSKLNFDSRLGMGGQVGVFVMRNLAVEADVLYTRTKTKGNLDVRHTPLRARVVYGYPVGSTTTLLAGVGYVRNIFRANYRETNSGIGGLIGGRYDLNKYNLGIRVNLTGDYVPTAESDIVPPQVAGVEHKKSNFHFGIEAGVSLLIPTKRGQ